MFVISRHAKLTLPIRASKPVYNPHNGAVEKVIPALVVEFQHSGTVPDYAREAVTNLPDWGQGIGLDEDPFERCGVIDTDSEAERHHWSPEDKALVEDVLERGSGSLYVVANPPKASKPWPLYDTVNGEDAAKQIAFQVELLGLPVSDVLKYERENAKRDDVIAALESLADAPEDVAAVIQA